MKKFVLALAICAALAACKKEEAPADAAAAPTDAAAPAAAAPADAAASTASIPAACEEYFKRAEACFTKAGAGGAAMKTAFDQSREQMSKVPSDQMEAGCKMANDSFAQTAAALKCE